MLAGSCDWFKGGSRIIITTRDAGLLQSPGVQSRIYNMELFNTEESRELFILHAFGKNQVDPSYQSLLNRAITYAQGLPLALEIIGANLRGMTSIREWESALDLYEKVPEKNILKILKVSYDGLSEEEQNIFLDIACFFIGTEPDDAKFVVEKFNDFNPDCVFRVLKNKCLMKIDINQFGVDVIVMHDLIRDMGRDIVQKESPNKPGEWSRLWVNQNIVDVLEENSGTDKIRMIIIEEYLWPTMVVNWDGEGFRDMTGLEVLILNRGKFSEGPKYLPNSLKVLTWPDGSHFDLPPNFRPKKLLHLDLMGSGVRSLESIKDQFTEIPSCLFLLPQIQEIKINIELDMEGLNYGEECTFYNEPDYNLTLPRCNISDDLMTTHLCRFINVKYLDLSGNPITILPSWIEQCNQLQTLMLNDCKHLRELQGIPPNIQTLEAANCTSLSSYFINLLLSEELHEDPNRYTRNRYDYDYQFVNHFCVPSRSMPEWFEHTSKGASISFWFRNSLPPLLCFCFLVKPQDNFLYSDYHHSLYFQLGVFINGDEKVVDYLDTLSFHFNVKQFDDHHLVVYHLSRKDIMDCFKKKRKDSIDDDETERDEWNLVEITVTEDDVVDIEESGMYVIKQPFDMQISFHNPHVSLDSTSSGPGMMKEKEGALNRKRRLMGDDSYATEHRSIDLDLNIALLPVLPSEHIYDTFTNQGHRSEDYQWLSLRPCWETPFYDWSSCSEQEFQQQENITTLVNVEQVPPQRFENNKRAKGKEKVIYNDYIHDEQ